MSVGSNTIAKYLMKIENKMPNTGFVVTITVYYMKYAHGFVAFVLCFYNSFWARLVWLTSLCY